MRPLKFLCIAGETPHPVSHRSTFYHTMTGKSVLGVLVALVALAAYAGELCVVVCYSLLPKKAMALRRKEEPAESNVEHGTG
jgi:hypothetical protein